MSRCQVEFPLPLPGGAPDPELLRAYQRQAARTVATLAARANRPAAMAPFDRLMGEPAELEAIADGSRPTVGYLCNFVPDELVLAAGARPLRLDLGLAEAAEAGARQLTADVCPEVRALIGARLGALPHHQGLDLLVVPTACDGKKKLARAFASDPKGPEVWVMALPQSREQARAQRAWREEVAALAHRLEQLSGARRIRRRELRRAVELVNRRTALSRALYRLRRERPGLLAAGDAFLVMQASFFAEPAWWVERTEALLAELQDAPAPARAPGVRLALVGSPLLFPQFKLLELLAGAGAEVVTDEMCSTSGRLYHPTVLDEGARGGMIRAAADKTLLPCTCPCFVGGDRRVERTLQLCRDAAVQGVVHHGLRLCQLYELELPALAAALRDAGLPLLSLTSEFSGEDRALLQNRVEAFVEMLEFETV